MESAMTLSFSREFAQQYGITAALVYKELYRKYYYWANQGKLVDGYFWCDQLAIADWLLITRQTLARTVAQLKEAGLIETETHYKPGTKETTTWWKISNWASSNQQNVTSYGMEQNVTSYIKADTKADTEEESQDEVQMKPEVLYSRVHSFFKGPNEMRKQKVEAIRKLRDEYSLSDDTIISGMKAIADDRTIKFENGSEFTYTLTYLLLTSPLEKTATLLVRKAEESAAKKPVSDRLKNFVKITDM